MQENKFKNLSRPINPMPELVREALEKEGLMSRFLKRPAYQQNDYLGWINRAVKDETKLKRLNQMIDELIDGGLYMKMHYN